MLAVLSETEEKEIEVLMKLKDTVDKQRDDLRKQKRDLSQKSIDCEAVRISLNNLKLYSFCEILVVNS